MSQKAISYPFFARAARILNSGQSKSILLCGNVHDLFFVPGKGGAEEAYEPLVRFLQSRWGVEGIALLLLIMGALDVDASIVTAGGLPAAAIGSELAAVAIAGTIIANMAVKIGTTAVYAGSKGRPAVAALAASTLVLAGSIAFAWVRLP